jgi:hypothetical protein
MYGVEFLREYDPNDDEHIARKHRLCELPSGPKLLPDAFDCILARVCTPSFSHTSEHILNISICLCYDISGCIDCLLVYIERARQGVDCVLEEVLH